MGHLYHEIILSNKNKLPIYSTAWMDLKGMMLRKKSQSQATYIMPFI